MESTRTWFTTKEILETHKQLPIRQIYLWFITQDNKMPIVAGKSGNFQLPGGKPEESETHLDTIKREMFEETGITIDNNTVPELFGYYLIENDPNWNLEPYLQVRYVLKVKELSSNFELSLNERENDKDTMQQVRFIYVLEIPEYIPYLAEREEFRIIKM